MSADGAPLQRYRDKRDFALTPEPPALVSAPAAALTFVIQKHWASRLHYDFRLEFDGVLLSWALPKGPSFDPADKRMAIHVEDHPVSYGSFEGTIPPKQYGAGKVIVWDRGTWTPLGDVRQALAAGKLVFKLHGEKLAGTWELVRIAKPGDRQDPWILFKKRDEWARSKADYDVVAALPDSVVETPLGLLESRQPHAAAPAAAVTSPPSAEAGPDLRKAAKAPLPAALAPQLATLAAEGPSGPGWALEPKWDGYRLLTRVERSKARLFTRNGHDWTSKMPAIAAAVETMAIKSGWLDGEIVVLDDRGAPDFNALQNAMDARNSAAIVYFLFDVPFLDGADLRQVPLAARRTALEQLMPGPVDGERIRLSPQFDAPAAQMLQAACAMGLEGIIAKRLDAGYVSARSESWLKLKCQRRQEFVVVGYTDRANSPGEVGSLLLAYYDAGRLRYAGNVGTGWNHATGRDLHSALVALHSARPMVDAADVKPGRWGRRTAGGERWVEPQMVVEVAFGEWTPDNHVRHAVFKGVRSDKPAADVTRETSAARPAGAGAAGAAGAAKGVAGVKVTNPSRVIDPGSQLTKLDLVRFYESVAKWMLPHLKDRPVSLVRAPQGIGGELFFQKHPEAKMPGLKVLDPALWPDHAALLTVHNAEALVSAAQMNTVEFHTWNSTSRSIDKPDRIVFDLDPGEGVSWSGVQEAATLVHAMLEALALPSWLKTSGGKGLHVVVPIAPRLGYEAVKDFSQAVVQHMARTLPQKFVAKSGPANRVGRIFIDYLRNGHGQTTAAAFSARARPGMGVSMPVSWAELPSLKSGAQWTVATAREHLSFQTIDPWADYWTTRTPLTKAIKMLKAASAA